MKRYNFAVVGASGMVGQMMLKVLGERGLPFDKLYLYSSKKSAGKTVSFLGKDYTLIELTKENVLNKKIDIAFFSAGGAISQEFAPIFAQNGTLVIDNSSYWRMDKDVPLVVPEVNPHAISLHKNIIANPNCSTIQAVVALSPLHKAFSIKRIVYSTYQAVSGAGMAGFEDLKNGALGQEPKKFPKPIFGNVIPHIDVFLESGYTKEEQKMIDETHKILDDYSIKVTATTVRVPVYHGHSESINVEFNKKVTLSEVMDVLKKADGVVLCDDIKNGVYPTPIECEGHDEVFVGRVRLDDSVESGINMWVVADNIRKGAATNAIQIAEKYIKLI